MVSLDEVSHLPVPQRVSKEDSWYHPIEVAEIEIFLRDECNNHRFREGKRRLAYVAGRIEKENKHYLLFSYEYHLHTQGIFSQKPRALDDIAMYKKIASIE